MATKEGTRASAEFMCICLAPDVCKSPTIPVPYKILSLFDCAVNFSTNVRFRTQFAFRHNSRLSTVRCDEVGVGGGVLSGVNMGFCRPIPTTHSKTVRVNGSFVDYHVGTYMFMNCAGPEGPFNTIGQVIFLGNMLPGPVSPSGKIPKGCICGDSGILSDIQSSLGDADDLIKKGKMLYSLATTDWSDPSAVLGAIGGVAGIAGLQDVAKYAGQAKELHDTGKKLLNTDFSDPLQALGAVAGLGNIPGMSDVSKIAGLASTIGNTIKTDWSNPQAALAAATNIMKSTGLNQMAAQMLSNAILDSNIPVTQSGTTPPFFPKPGAANNGNGSSSGTSSASNVASTSGSSSSKQSAIPPSSDGKPRQHITPDVLDYLKQTNTAAYERYNLLSDSDKANAFVEMGPPSKDSNGSDYSPNDRTAIYIPGEGFSTSKEERDSLPNVSQYIPSRIRELFVADKQDATQGNFFGIKEKEGNVYLFGGLIDLGSPELPGAGNTQAWWVPDRILNMDMSPYYDHHDKGYYGSNVGLKDLGKILSHELEAFKAGATLNPLQLPLQAIYSAATTAVGLGTAVTNEATKIGSGDFSSLKDFYGSVFGGSSVNPIDSQIMTIAPGGCMGPEVPTLPGQSAPGTGSGAPGSGAPPKPGTAGASDGNASGAGKDGILVTTKQGNPAAIAATIEAQFRAENQANLEKAQTEERARQEQEAKKKADKEKAKNEPADHQFSTPLGPMTDAEIAAQQYSSDQGWGIEASVIPGGVDIPAVISAGKGFAKTNAEQFAKEYGASPGETNALQHTMWQALLAAEHGSDVAKAIGDQHEKWQQYGNSVRRADTNADLHNNSVGRQIGESVRAEMEAAKERGDESPDLVNAIRERIIQANKENRLDNSGGGDGVPPGDPIPPGIGPGFGNGKIHE